MTLPDGRTGQYFNSYKLKSSSNWEIISLYKVRGHKNVVRHFPHEVEDLVFVLDLLEGLVPGAAWEIKYVLILWLSIVVIIPFQVKIIHIIRFRVT